MMELQCLPSNTTENAIAEWMNKQRTKTAINK